MEIKKIPFSPSDNILLYGTGNGADKILDFLCFLDFPPPKAVAVSDNFFKEGKTFRGYNILPLSLALKEFKNPIILLAFGSDKPEVLSYFFELNNKYKLFAPDLPLFGEYSFLFEAKYQLENFSKPVFNDKVSEELYDNIYEYKKTWEIDFLKKAVSLPLFPVFKNISAVLDFGAYDGDTTFIFNKQYKNTPIFAFEPHPKIFIKLCNNTKNFKNIYCENIAVWSSLTEVSFTSSSGRGAHISNFSDSQNKKNNKNIIVKTDTIDNIAKKFSLTNRVIIKLDVEGVENSAIIGGSSFIKEYKPILFVSVYHRENDIYKIPTLISSIRSDYKFLLRRAFSVPAWDIILIAY